MKKSKVIKNVIRQIKNIIENNEKYDAIEKITKKIKLSDGYMTIDQAHTMYNRVEDMIENGDFDSDSDSDCEKTIIIKNKKKNIQINII